MNDENGNPIHKWRWRVLALWIIIFTVAVGYGLRQNRNNITEVKHQSVKVHALQVTNCRLSLFLLAARRARWDAYKRSKNKTDLQAVKAYERLVAPFVKDENAIDGCIISSRLVIKGRPLRIDKQA